MIMEVNEKYMLLQNTVGHLGQASTWALGIGGGSPGEMAPH